MLQKITFVFATSFVLSSGCAADAFARGGGGDDSSGGGGGYWGPAYGGRGPGDEIGNSGGGDVRWGAGDHSRGLGGPYGASGHNCPSNTYYGNPNDRWCKY